MAERLRAAHPGIEVQILEVRTTGDRQQEASLQVIGGKGAFTKEVQDAVLEGRADLAVHSLKDLPTESVPGLRVAAYPPRFDPRDAWIGRNDLRFAHIPAGAVVATGAQRRRAQVLHVHPEVRVEEIRGNVDTRLRKFDHGEMTGMFLAVAGLQRLDLVDRITEPLDPTVFLPAPGQGALAVEGRDDGETNFLLGPLDDPPTRCRVSAERAFLAEMEAGCQIPLAALATEHEGRLALDGLVASLDGRQVLRDRVEGSANDPITLGEILAARLRARGADAILEAVRAEMGPEA